MINGSREQKMKNFWKENSSYKCCSSALTHNIQDEASSILECHTVLLGVQFLIERS